MPTRNRYPGRCSGCSADVAALAGVLGRKIRRRFTVKCLRCAGVTEADLPPLPEPRVARKLDDNEDVDCDDPDNAAPPVPAYVRHRDGRRSIVTYFPVTGATIYQNRNGRCIDAPCCGCCS